MDLQLRLVSGWGLWKRRSAPPYEPLGLEKDYLDFLALSQTTIHKLQKISSDVSVINVYWNTAISMLLGSISKMNLLWVIVLIESGLSQYRAAPALFLVPCRCTWPTRLPDRVRQIDRGRNGFGGGRSRDGVGSVRWIGGPRSRCNITY